MTRRSLRLARAGLAGAGLAGAVGTATWLWRNQDKLIMRRPFNQWAFTHMNRLLPYEEVPRARSPQPWPDRSGPLDVEYWFQGRRRNLAQRRSVHLRCQRGPGAALVGPEAGCCLVIAA